MPGRLGGDCIFDLKYFHLKDGFLGGRRPILSRVASIRKAPLLSLHRASLRESNLARLPWALILKWWALPQEFWRALAPRSTPRASLRDFSSRAAKGKTAFVDGEVAARATAAVDDMLESLAGA